MSKSKGNGVDPLEVIQESGADALRFAMTYASTGGQDIRWDPRRVEMGRTFTNKLWNAARFAFLNLEGPEDAGPPERLADRWIRARLARAVATVTDRLEAFDLGAANPGRTTSSGASSATGTSRPPSRPCRPATPAPATCCAARSRRSCGCCTRWCRS